VVAVSYNQPREIGVFLCLKLKNFRATRDFQDVRTLTSSKSVNPKTDLLIIILSWGSNSGIYQ